MKMKTLLDAIDAAQAAALRNTLPPGTSERCLLGYTLSALKSAARALARCNDRGLADALTAVLVLAQVGADPHTSIVDEILEIAQEAKVAQDELREALAAAYAGRRAYRDWEEAAADILDNARPGSHAEYAVAVAIVSLGSVRRREALRKAFGMAGVEMCSQCDEPIGIGCGAPYECPVCKGHGWSSPEPNHQDCQTCDGSGLRSDYDRLQAAESNAHVA